VWGLCLCCWCCCCCCCYCLLLLLLQEAGAVPAGIAALFGAANRALGKATSSFIGQVGVEGVDIV
jgi:hypothetical protein